MIKKNNTRAILCLGIILVSGSLFVGHLLSHNIDTVKQENSKILGIVKSGEFIPVWPEKSVVDFVRLTKIQMQEARSPESGELDLSKYEGQAIMVNGNGGGGGWVYNARIVDAAGPILPVCRPRRHETTPTCLFGSSPRWRFD